MSQADRELDVRLIKPGDKLTGLSLGHADFTPLKTFLRKHALTYEAQSLARTYAVFDGARVLAYITLVCGEVVVGDDDDRLVDEPGLKYLYNHYPAIKIARLAVDTKVSRSGLGRFLVQLAFGRAKDIICPAVGCRFVMVDSKRQSVKFYERCGFTMLDTEANKGRDEPVMFVDLSKMSAEA